MYFINIYFILGLAMLLVVLWDPKNLTKTANRLVKQAENKTGFSPIAQEILKWVVILLVAFFLWPLVVIMELSGKKEK